MIKLIAVTPHSVNPIPLTGLLPVGGKAGSGYCLRGLKESDDYAVVSCSGSEVAVHLLKGKKKGSVSLKPGEAIVIDDLTLAVLDESSFIKFAGKTAGKFADGNSGFGTDLEADLGELLRDFSTSENLFENMKNVLKKIIAVSAMEKGLIIFKNSEGDFKPVAREGVSGNEPWMSESLIQETLQSQKGISIQNIYGSPFQSNRSLMATGFISVQTWPLTVRGETLGIILVGSLKPHSGLGLREKSQGDILANLAALTLWFHLRDIKLSEEVAALKKIQPDSDDGPLTTGDKRLLETEDIARKVAPTTLSVLIQGETGVGKELLASWIHSKGDRSSKPFVAVNCGAIPGELLESILFGHKKGSFTGAAADQTGKFQLADGGTLFLDEIGDLPELLQVKLLRALQEKMVEPLGSNKPSKIDVRVIAATHRSLTELVAQGKFREDLYFRLAEIVLEIPPLRSRPEDIGLLSTLFLKKNAPTKRFSTSAWNWLKAQEWRGNTRELMSAVKRSGILAEGEEITVADLTKGLARTATLAEKGDWLGGANLDEAKERFVDEKVKLALQRSGGQRNKAADLLGVTPRTLFRYLEDKKIEL